ncbi:MAG: chromosomal replication initiator [Beijerinckiaceae bacterium]|nr:MAG: chromosomal replication initiator [Beijerinckiaceae bacterium]
MSDRDQLLLPLLSSPRFGREDFLVGRANDAAFAYIERWPRWLAPAVVIAGPEGSGKTHLAAIFAAKVKSSQMGTGWRQDFTTKQEDGEAQSASPAHATLLRGDHLDPAAVPGLSRAKALVLEDCDRFPPDEVALFHLINLARETGLFIVMTARTAPDGWGIRTPDLLSRLRLQPLLELHEPDDALLGALFVKHFSDRQISVEANVVTYAMARIERSYAAVQSLVAALDRHSLIRKKPVTRALVAEVLGDAAMQDDGSTPETRS